MNLNYCYDHMEDWDRIGRDVKPSSLEILVHAIGLADEDRKNVDRDPRYDRDLEEVKKLPAYHYKTGCLDDPEMIARLNARGLHYETLEMGATRGIVLTPLDTHEKKDRKLPLLITFHKEDYFDPFWAMKTLQIYSGYVDSAARNLDRTNVFIVTNNEPARNFGNMITDCIQNYSGDKSRVYIDLSLVRGEGRALKDIDGFFFQDGSGAAVDDPDRFAETFDGVPVLNYSGRWASPWRPHPINSAGDGTVDAQWQIHSEFGRKMLEQRRFSARYASPDDPGVRAYWEQMGLNYNCHFVHDERWVIFTPAASALEKLPVVVCLSEVNEPDDHSIISAFATFRGYCDIAAQGDCAVIFFAMESPRWNDWICEILQDAAGMYPIDLSRVYMTGHSHNGHFTQEFARRHPNVLACIAPLGNSPGLPTPAVSHEAVAVTDEMAARMETMDMPTCILCGCKEVGGLVPVNKTAHAFEPGINVEGYAASAEGKMAMWNRRLKAERCPQQSVEELLAAADSPNKAIRALGFPSDRAETVYLDGFEHYIADVRNNDGKYHFRVIAIENMPHMVVPSMHVLAWNYMRRFARDRENGAVIELF
ncbi:MAG: hypothetical protein ACI3XJ_11265 [Oscillospiraceae bacterium]